MVWPSTFVTSDVVTAAELEAMRAIGDAWGTWTPTLANLTIGNGTTVARYITVGKTVHFRITITLGSTSAVGTNPTFTLPVAPQSTDDVFYGRLTDTGTGFYPGSTFSHSGSTVTMGTASSPIGGITSTAPFTWATGDIIVYKGSYEAA